MGCGVLRRRQVAEGAMGTVLVVVDPPRFDDGLGVGERMELMHVRLFIAASGIEGPMCPLSVGCRAREVERDACSKAQVSRAIEVNSVPWSTVIDRGCVPACRTRSRAAATSPPVTRWTTRSRECAPSSSRLLVFSSSDLYLIPIATPARITRLRPFPLEPSSVVLPMPAMSTLMSPKWIRP